MLGLSRRLNSLFHRAPKRHLALPSSFSSSKPSFSTFHTSFDIHDAEDLPGLTADPFDKFDNTTSKCRGCGVPLQTSDPSGTGYIPQSRLEKYPGGVRKTFEKIKGVPVDHIPNNIQVEKNSSLSHKYKVQLLYCQQCLHLQTYHRLHTKINQGEAFYQIPNIIHQNPSEALQNLLKTIPRESVVVQVIDLLDFEASLLPELYIACRSKDIRIIWAINKVDCLPSNIGLSYIRDWVRRVSRQLKNTPMCDIVLVSGATGLGLDSLESSLNLHLRKDGSEQSVYFVGRLNAGKSSLINRLLGSVKYSHMGTLNLRQSRGGVTVSSIPGSTQSNIAIRFPKNISIVDTPGIPHSSHITSKLNFIDDLHALVPRKKIKPISYPLKVGKSLFIGSLIRIDNTSSDTAVLTLFFPPSVTIHQCSTNKAMDFMKRKATTYLCPPSLPEDFKKMQPFVKHKIDTHGETWRSWDDVSIAGIGWFAVTGWGRREFDVWVPKGVAVFRRPSMLPYEVHRGVRKWRRECGRGRGPHKRDRMQKLREVLLERKKREEYWKKQLEQQEEGYMGEKEEREGEAGEKDEAGGREETKEEGGVMEESDMVREEDYERARAMLMNPFEEME